MKITGKAIIFGKDIDTDVILPGKYLVLVDPKDLAKHAMEGIDPNFPKKAEKALIVVAGENFGCGSSREQAPLALKYSGVKCVLAESFARIFFRNSINIGLLVIECQGISEVVDNNDDLTIDPLKGIIENNSKSRTIQGNKLPQFIIEILNDGGLIENLRRRLKNERI